MGHLPLTCLLAFTLSPDAPQDSAHAANQFARAEWLDDIVICADVQTLNTIILVAARGQHQDRGF